jgi:hypothetical protein
MEAKIELVRPTIAKLGNNQIHTLLKPGEFAAMLDYKLTDPNGKVLVDVSKKSESFVKGFLQCLQVLMTKPHLSSLTFAITDTGNTSRNIYVYKYQANINTMDVNAAVNISTHGIVVGTGNTAPTIADYALQTQIAHGTGAGQLQYSASTFGSPAADATTSQFTITRNFANGSGGSITVNEVGLYCKMYDGTARYICIIRDVIAGGIVIANGQTLTVNYRPQALV